MSLSHACISAIVCCVKTPVLYDTQGARVVVRSKLDWVLKLLNGWAFLSSLQKWITQNKTGQMTARHLTSEFGCGGRI